MRWGIFVATWDWLIAELAKPGVVTGLLALVASAVIVIAIIGGVLYLLLRAIRWVMDHQFREAKEHLLERYAIRYGFLGIPRAPLVLIAECMALVFLLRMLAELAEPFILTFLSPDMSAHILGLARYDWAVLGSLVLLVVVFWARFCLRVKEHDATKLDSKIDRRWSRTVPIFLRPATALLLLMFLPDISRFAAVVVADWIKESLPEFARAEAAGHEPLLGRNYAGGLRVTVTLEPKERVATGTR